MQPTVQEVQPNLYPAWNAVSYIEVCTLGKGRKKYMYCRVSRAYSRQSVSGEGHVLFRGLPLN